jgi:Prokaryotic Cytochrome C oxidase subunit IV
MTSFFRSTLTGVWALLSIITIASWWTGSRSDGRAYGLVTAGVLLFALVKSRLVIRYFMEVRFAPRWLRLTCDLWLITVFGMAFALYLGRP